MVEAAPTRSRIRFSAREPNVQTLSIESVRLAGLMAVAVGFEAKRQARIAYCDCLVRESKDLAAYIIAKAHRAALDAAVRRLAGVA